MSNLRESREQGGHHCFSPFPSLTRSDDISGMPSRPAAVNLNPAYEASCLHGCCLLTFARSVRSSEYRALLYLSEGLHQFANIILTLLFA